MATVVTKKLRLDESNIEKYCDAKNISFSVSGHAWRKWLNGSSDGYIILKDAGKSELFPTRTAHPFKADSTISASRSAGTCIVDLQFSGTKVHEESFTSTSQKSKAKANITNSAITNSNRTTEIKWHVHGKNGDNQRGEFIELTLYFNQYSAKALTGNEANGIQSVNVSNSTPYYGDFATFSAELVSGAEWRGWYSDAACTILVSTDQNYIVSPSSDITLYASATIDAATYSCAAIAKDGIMSATVSDSVVTDGGNCTFSAQLETGYVFEGWYSDKECTNLISADNPYTATIVANTTLYAKARKKDIHLSVGQAEHGTSSVSASTVPYGTTVTYTFTPEDSTWKLYGWYSDADCTKLVSKDNPYSFSAIENVTLYPKVGLITYKVTLTSPQIFLNTSEFTLTIFAYYESKLSEQDILNLHKGQFSELDDTKFEGKKSVTGRISFGDVTVSLDVPIGCTCFLYSSTYADTMVCICPNGNQFDTTTIADWPYYTFIPTSDKEYFAKFVGSRCNCSGIAKEGIEYTDVTNPTAQGKAAIFKAKVRPGYAFAGWYSDEACTVLVSSENPTKVTTPTLSNTEVASFTLYALATSLSGTGLYLKQNGTHEEAKAIWKKENGIWTKSDKTIIDTTKKYRIIR